MPRTDDTQQCTQDALDPRRLGHSTSGLTEEDVSDVICVLHPSSPAAFRIVSNVARTNPQHILQNQGLDLLDAGGEDTDAEEAETILVKSMRTDAPPDIALRFSSCVFNPSLGFVFGRNKILCDINLDPSNNQRRVSNKHFRIYMNDRGILMLTDMSTNGTIVDGTTLGGKRPQQPHDSRILLSGAIIEILAPESQDMIKFVLRIPPRDGHEDQHFEKYRAYMEHAAIAKERQIATQQDTPMPEAAARGMLAAPLAGPPNTRNIPRAQSKSMTTARSKNSPMHWDGGGKYQLVGMIGRGAFATVYQIATTYDGDYFAAKEFDKKRFMKGGVLDNRISNEMQIMKDLSHPNIVRYIDYVEIPNHLYIIMEFISGGDLTGYIQSHGYLSEDLARSMSRQILSALAYLHEENITHRDIKPDNILIHSEDPFTVKLTDFGLSKAVKTNNTFMSTFCGTLLYCAPEVYPYWDNYSEHKATKRRRHQDNEEQTKRHTYSKLVDVYSYAAVAWNMMCGKPPYEGTAENQGRGMFERITRTPLDTSPLQEYGISSVAIDLLVRMLHIDPMNRPSVAECLSHPWLDGQVELAEWNGPQNNDQTEDLDASGLSLDDRSDEDGTNKAEQTGSFGSDEARQSKRLKAAESDPFDLERIAAQAGAYNQSIPIINDVHNHHNVGRRQKLFGEISQPNSEAALTSSAALGRYSDAQLSDQDRFSHQEEAPLTNSKNGQTSLSRAESMVRALQVGKSGNTVPHTPKQSPDSSILGDQAGSNQHRQCQSYNDIDKTPKAKKPFDRRINLPVTASYYYDPHDPSTHNVEYASRTSGLDFVDENTAYYENDMDISLPIRLSPHDSQKENEHSQPQKDDNIMTRAATLEPQTEPGQDLPQQSDSPDQHPIAASAPAAVGSTPDTDPSINAAPFFGELTSTTDSFTDVTIPIRGRCTTWGRSPACTISYPFRNDSRIPKIGLELWLHAPEIASIEARGEDWTQMKGLDLVVHTGSRNGIWVNGVCLTERDKRGRTLYGRLREGDEIVIFCDLHVPDGDKLVLIVRKLKGEVGRLGPRRPDEAPFGVQVAGDGGGA